MRFPVVLRYVGVVMLFVAGFMLLSAGISYVSGRDSAFYPLLLSALLTALLGGFPLLFVERQEKLSAKEGYCIVVGAWLVACIVGMFPYLIWGGEFSVINAWFESCSGFTTTGASILQDVEALPRGLLFWRMSTSWIGGVGVVMFALLILPSIGRSKKLLSNIELSTLAHDNFQYRTQMIVQILLVVYVGMTLLTVVLLHVAGMNWFDSLTHAMSACSTCGFGIKNNSIAYYDSIWIECVLMFAMAIAGIHFGLIFTTITGKRNNILRSEVVRVYAGIILAGGLIIALSLWFNGIFDGFWASFRRGVFQFVAVFTTTGFATADSSVWPSLAVVVLIFGSVVCACAGSTSGGMKTDRLLLAVKTVRANLKMQQHPNAIIRVRVGGMLQEEETVHTAMIFIVTYVLFILLGTVINAVTGMGLIESFTGSIACLGNVGPGFGSIGSMSNYAEIPSVAKFSSSLLMLFGRLEIFGLIQLFFIKWWR